MSLPKEVIAALPLNKKSVVCFKNGKHFINGEEVKQDAPAESRKITNEQRLSIQVELLEQKIKLHEMIVKVIAQKAIACLASTKANYQANVDSLIEHAIMANNSLSGGSND